MDRKKTLFIVICLLLGFLKGCGTSPPTQTQLNWADRERTRIKDFMREVQSHIRAGDYEDIMRKHVYRGRGTTADQRYANYANFKRATWIPELSGYQILNIDRVLRDLHWTDLNEGEVSLEVEAICARGRRRKDSFGLFRPGGEWLITTARLRPPASGSIIELGSRDIESINLLQEPLLEALTEGRVRQITDMLPDTFEARYRERRAGLFGWFLGWIPWGRTRTTAIEDDLLQVAELNIERRPTPEEGFPARYAGGMSAFFSYSLPYTTDGSNARAGNLDLRIYVRENEGKEWELRKIRLRGRPLPR